MTAYPVRIRSKGGQKPNERAEPQNPEWKEVVKLEKKISVKMAGQTDSRIYDIKVKPNTTGKQILEELNLNGYLLFDENNNPLPLDKDLYPLVKEGQKVIAASPMVVG